MAISTIELINRTWELFDQASNSFGFDPLRNRTKAVRVVMTKIEGYWVPMLVCDHCGNGPIDGLADDSCCE